MASESTKRPQDGHHPALCVGELAAEQQSSSLLPHPPPAKTAAGCCARGGHSHVPIKAGAMDPMGLAEFFGGDGDKKTLKSRGLESFNLC